MMKTSENFTRLLIGFEGERLAAYKDSAGKWTIGIGHLLKVGDGFTPKSKITLAESRALFAKDTASTVAALNKLVKTALNQNQFDALVSLVFNIGAVAFAGSSVLRKINQNDFKSAASHFLDWNKTHVNGKLAVVRGLTDRRTAERALFEK